MVNCHICNYRKQRSFNYIGGVCISAHSALNYCNITFTAVKVFKCSGSKNFKFCRRVVHTFGKRINKAYYFSKQQVGDFPAVYLYAFVYTGNVRRCKKSCFTALSLQNRGQHTAYRAFSVCSRYMNDFGFSLRITHKLQKFNNS